MTAPGPSLPIRLVGATGSTNADLVALILGAGRWESGAWLVADRQEAGRGRQGRAWLDGPGNFMGSTALAIGPDDPPLPSLSFVAALAVYRAAAQFCAEPGALSLKWPNDVLLAGAKLAGILLERAGDHAVIGIGVNLAGAPRVPGRALAALGQGGRAPDRDAFARVLALAFEEEVGWWRAGGAAEVFARWLALAHPPGSSLRVHGAGDTALVGTFVGLAPDGGLRLRLADGTTHVIRAGDVMLEG